MTHRVAHSDEVNDRRFYTVHETAARLNVSASTIWRWIETGRLLAVRLGPKIVRIPEDEVEHAYQPAYRRQDEPTMLDFVYANAQTTVRPLSRLEKRHGRESIAGLRALQEQIRRRRGGAFLPNSLDVIHESREQRSKEI